jgi:kynurenine formamidase
MKKQSTNTLIDLSQPITDDIPAYPGDTPARLKKINDFTQDGFNNFCLTSSMHIGTHIDGPMHLTKSNCFIDELPLKRFIGIGNVLNAVGMKVIPYTQEFASIVIPKSIVLIYTGFGKKYGSKKYYYNYPVISMDLVRFFIKRQIKMICLDTPSPDKYPYDIHTYLLKNSVLIAENLTRIEKLLTVKKFEIIAFPLQIHADSSPARIVARILE